LSIYKNSVSSLVPNVFPELNLFPWKFVHDTEKVWKDPANKRKFLEWAGSQLEIKDVNDWYRVKIEVTRYPK
jgi:hypothetical protein